MHWVVAEAIAPRLRLHTATGEPAYAGWYETWWDTSTTASSTAGWVVAARAVADQPAEQPDLAGQAGHLPRLPGDVDPPAAAGADAGDALRRGLARLTSHAAAANPTTAGRSPGHPVWLLVLDDLVPLPGPCIAGKTRSARGTAGWVCHRLEQAGPEHPRELGPPESSAPAIAWVRPRRRRSAATPRSGTATSRNSSGTHRKVRHAAAAITSGGRVRRSDPTEGAGRPRAWHRPVDRSPEPTWSVLHMGHWLRSALSQRPSYACRVSRSAGGRVRPRHDADRHRRRLRGDPGRARRRAGRGVPDRGDDLEARDRRSTCCSSRTCRPSRSSRRPTGSGRSTPTSRSTPTPAFPGVADGPGRRTPPRRAHRAGHRQAHPQRPAARRPPRARRGRRRGHGSGGPARARCCAATGPTSTSATTSTTSRAPGPPGSSASRC